MKTKVVHCNKESYDVLIDRTTIWGNPFQIGKDGSRSDVIQKFRQWLNGDDYKTFKQKERQLIIDNIYKLTGCVLGCWCKPRACHGDVYKEILEEIETGILNM